MVFFLIRRFKDFPQPKILPHRYYDRGRDFRNFHHQTSPEVIEGIFGEEIWKGILVQKTFPNLMKI